MKTAGLLAKKGVNIIVNVTKALSKAYEENKKGQLGKNSKKP